SFCQLLRRQHSAWISAARQPPGTAGAGSSVARCSWQDASRPTQDERDFGGRSPRSNELVRKTSPPVSVLPNSFFEQMTPQETRLRDGRIVHREAPLNLEMPFSTLDSFLTPTKSFYVRTHFPIPAIDRDAWWLHVEG